MIGPLTAVRRLTSTATGLATSTVRTGVSVATTAAQGALHLVTPGSPAAPGPVAKAKEAVKETVQQKVQEQVAKAEPTPDPMAPTVEAPVRKAAPRKKPAARKKASEVPLKSAPTPSSAAPPIPEGPDVLPGEEGANGLAEPEPLLDASVAKQLRAESETLRKGAE